MSNGNTPTVTGEVSRILSTFVTELTRSSVAGLLRLLRQTGLSMPRAVTLLFLDREGEASISDISNYLNLSLGNTSHIVNQLVCEGYVTRMEDSTDRRQKVVQLTAKGATFVEEVKLARSEELARRLEGMPAPLLSSTLTVMAEVNAYLTAQPVEA
jgi:DNA-binding MarR family transcriptional regulator